MSPLRVAGPSPVGLRIDFNTLRRELRRERVRTLNDAIHAVSHAGEAFVKMGDAEGVITASTMLNALVEGLGEAISEEGDNE